MGGQRGHTECLGMVDMSKNISFQDKNTLLSVLSILIILFALFTTPARAATLSLNPVASLERLL